MTVEETKILGLDVQAKEVEIKILEQQVELLKAQVEYTKAQTKSIGYNDSVRYLSGGTNSYSAKSN
jgi:hypothetical protein